jgi:hypothetical protein
MRPLVVLLGIVMGSTVSIALGLVMTGVVFLLIHDTDSRLADETRPLLGNILLSLALAGVAFASFLGELRQKRWRFLAHAGLVLMLGIAVLTYWPRE